MPHLTPLTCPSGTEVHIFRTEPTRNCHQYVSPEEISRAGRIINPVKRDYFLAGRAYLRSTLGRYLQLHERDIHFQTGQHGKQSLSGCPTRESNLYFNLSHSGTLLILAIAARPNIGIDLEQIQQEAPIDAMARLAFSPLEQAELTNYREDQRIAAFYRCWTRKEAYLKGCGSGFARHSNSFDVSLVADPVVMLRLPESRECWYLQNIDVPDGYCASFAIQEDAATITYLA